jgi:hypothetical protein
VRRTLLAALLVLPLAPVAAAHTTRAAAATTLPLAGNCPVFPADNVWNTDISQLPVDSHSAAWLASMNAGSTDLHPDFGSGGDPNAPYGIPYNVVTSAHPKVPVTFDYADESDPGPYPFGPDIQIEGGQGASGDRHAIMVDASTCTLYELYDATYSPNGSTAGSGAIWDLSSDALRPANWTSADAAGLPIFPGLLRPEEVLAGFVTHAIRFTAVHTQKAYIWPARHQAGDTTDPNVPPMGARFRLKMSFDISHFSPATQVVLRAMQHYGLILADNGSNWYFQGAASNSWGDQLISELKQVPASAFEAVDESSLMVNANSGATNASGAPSPGPVPSPGPAPSPGPVPSPAPTVPAAPGGYRLVASDGGIFSFNAPFYGSTGNRALPAPVVSTVSTPDGKGYWLLGADGTVYPFGDAGSYGSAHGFRAVGMAPTADGKGYWVVGSNCEIAAFGDASPYTGPMPPGTVAAVATAPGGGFWYTTVAGTVLAVGGAPALTPQVPSRLNAPIVGLAATADGKGLWEVAGDGGIFTAGDAAFYGSTGNIRLNQPVVGMAGSSDGKGYWLVAADGGIFTFGDAGFHGSTGNLRLNAPVIGMTAAA